MGEALIIFANGVVGVFLGISVLYGAMHLLAWLVARTAKEDQS
ncbi:MAG: hypothetical protein ACUVWY_07525 [Desulfosoma sp.]